MDTGEDAIQKLVEADPLLLFDLYPMLQARYVDELGAEILNILDTFLDNQPLNGSDLSASHSKFWFWILGAYELIRTLSQHKSCFSDACQANIASLKGKISPIRIAFAKLEVPNARRTGNRTDFLDRSPFFSVSHVDQENKDLAFVIGGQYVGMRSVIVAFREFKYSLGVEDILAGLYYDRPTEGAAPR